MILKLFKLQFLEILTGIKTRWKGINEVVIGRNPKWRRAVGTVDTIQINERRKIVRTNFKESSAA